MRRSTKKAQSKERPVGINGDTYLAAQMQDRDFRRHFEQRRLVHEVAMAVRGMRAVAGLTQAQLARRIGSSQPTIARLETGLDQRTPQWDTLRKIAVALGRQMTIVFRQANDDGPFVEVQGPVSGASKRHVVDAVTQQLEPETRSR